jgi:hypothetical protein
MELDGLAIGMYIITVSDGENVIFKNKIIKQN